MEVIYLPRWEKNIIKVSINLPQINIHLQYYSNQLVFLWIRENYFNIYAEALMFQNSQERLIKISEGNWLDQYKFPGYVDVQQKIDPSEDNASKLHAVLTWYKKNKNKKKKSKGRLRITNWDPEKGGCAENPGRKQRKPQGWASAWCPERRHWP